VSDPATELRGFDRSLPMALLSAREAAMQHFRPMLAEHDLTEQQWRVLRALLAAGIPVGVSDLVGATNLLAPSLTRILANLESRALITRRTDPADQRRAEVTLSPTGQHLVDRVAPESEQIYLSIEERFGGKRLASLIGELHELSTLLTPADGGT